MPRPIWKGSITFGMVSIPIQLEMAVHEKSVHFHMMAPDGTCRLRRKLYCPETNKEFDFSDTARGIEIAKGEYVLVDESEIKQLKPERGHTIEIVQFIHADEIDPLYFDRAYYVVPTEGSFKPCKLLFDAMTKGKVIAIAHFVMRERQYTCAIRTIGSALLLHTLHYMDEVIGPEDAAPQSMVQLKSQPREIEMAQKLIESMTRSLNLAEFHDEYREQLEKMIDRRKQGKKMVVSGLPDQPPPRTVNLMDALRRSLAGAGSNGNGHAAPRKRVARTGRTPRARKS